MRKRPHLPSGRPADVPASVLRLAGEWLARRDRGLTRAEERDFDAWVQASPSHGKAVGQLEKTMVAFDRLRDLVPEAALAAEPDADTFAPRRRVPKLLLRLLPAAGIAAALAMGVWRIEDSSTRTIAHYGTAAAAYERAILADGSIIELNGNTRVEVDFTPSERNVRISQGEVHFQVAKNAARPFVVSANGVAFRAVGTAFNVRLGPSSVEMVVTEGVVKVEHAPAARPGSLPDTLAGGQIPLISAGHKVELPSADLAAAVIARVSNAEISRTLAWQPRVTEFKKTPLGEVVAEFNRRNEAQIVVGDPELNAVRIGGSFRVDQPDAFARLLETSFGISAERAGDVITLRKVR